MLKRLSITVILLLLTGISGYIMFNRQMSYCMLVGISKMDRISENVYISPDASPDEREKCLALVKEAKDRNSSLWGNIESNPVFIFCTNWGDYHDFGMYKTQAMSRMNFIGEYIILSPSGMTSDDVSHEMCHAELYTRVGYFNDRRIPLWFHEGLAMMVCREYPQTYPEYLVEWGKLTKSSPNILSLEMITSDEDFYSSPNKSNLAYWRSGMELARWTEEAGQEGLFELIESLNNGEDFEDTYREMEDNY